MNQPVEWSIHFIFFTGISYVFYKQGCKKMEQPLPKTTVSTIINSKHDLDYDDEDEEYLLINVPA